MKKLVLCFVFVLLSLSAANAQTYPTVSIHDLQFCPHDSLLKADSLGILAGPSAWALQTSQYDLSHTGAGDTVIVEIVGQVIVPPKIISFTGPGGPSPNTPPPSWNMAGGYNIVLRDTASDSTEWSSIFVRPSLAADTLALYQAGYLGLNAGDIIRLRGYIAEFPSQNMASYTEFVPVTQNFVLTTTMPDGPLEILGHKPVPPPIPATPSMFYKGISLSGKVMFSTGEPLEDCYVQMTNLKVSGIVNLSNGTFTLQDSAGNEISDLDASEWFSLRGSGNPATTWTLPAPGQVIDTIRGYISTNSGSEAARGYRINPCFPGDVVFGKVYPGVSTHRRNPVALTSSDTATITIKAFKQAGAGVPALKTVVLNYSLNNGPWVRDTMSGPTSDSTCTGQIPPQAANTFVRYYCTATDTVGSTTVYANAAGGSDTAQGFFFYTVLDRPLTIHDVQYTPYSNGYSGLLGAVVTVGGVVTADTSDLSLTSNGTTPWYIQDGSAPWSGIWVTGVDTMLSQFHDGDSISVTGTVQEFLQGTTGSFGRVTRIANVTAASLLAAGHAVPSPVVLTTGDFAVPNGDPLAEPYEGMLVRFNNVTVTDIAPTFADATEYTINDGSGPVIVRGADGKGRYSNVLGDTAYGKTIIRDGDRFSYIQGIIYFSYNQYKFVPGGNEDFGTYTAGVIQRTDIIPEVFTLSQNYPNPFNPTTRIAYDIPKTGVVSLKVYNILGQEVATIVNANQTPGHYVAEFDASRLASGLYIYALRSASGMIAKKMLLLK